MPCTARREGQAGPTAMASAMACVACALRSASASPSASAGRGGGRAWPRHCSTGRRRRTAGGTSIDQPKLTSKGALRKQAGGFKSLQLLAFTG